MRVLTTDAAGYSLNYRLKCRSHSRPSLWRAIFFWGGSAPVDTPRPRTARWRQISSSRNSEAGIEPASSTMGGSTDRYTTHEVAKPNHEVEPHRQRMARMRTQPRIGTEASRRPRRSGAQSAMAPATPDQRSMRVEIEPLNMRPACAPVSGGCSAPPCPPPSRTAARHDSSCTRLDLREARPSTGFSLTGHAAPAVRAIREPLRYARRTLTARPTARHRHHLARP